MKYLHVFKKLKKHDVIKWSITALVGTNLMQTACNLNTQYLINKNKKVKFNLIMYFINPKFLK